MAQATGLPIAAPRPRKRRLGGRAADQRLFIIAALVPTMLGLLVFWIYPLVNGLWGSFTDWRAFQSDRAFVGLGKYQALAADGVFFETLINTAQYTLLYLPLNVILGLALALAIEASGLAKSFGETRAVDGVDLAVRAGSVYGVLGPNGAGKTTTMKLLTAQDVAHERDIELHGHRLPAAGGLDLPQAYG